MKMKNIIKKQQKTIFIGFMSVALFIICICTVCTAYAADKDNAKTPVDIPGLTYDHSMELSYAEEFSVDYYNFKIIRQINESGTSILLIEQNAFLALTTASHAYVLETGKITMQGKSSDLLADKRVKDAYLGA